MFTRLLFLFPLSILFFNACREQKPVSKTPVVKPYEFGGLSDSISREATVEQTKENDFETGEIFVTMLDHPDADTSEMSRHDRKIVLDIYRIYKRKKGEVEQNKWAAKAFGLPSDCIVYEYVSIKKAPNRALALWIENPTVALNDLDDILTCPAQITGRATMGGKIHFSLLDLQSGQIINTIDMEKLAEDNFQSIGNELPLVLPSRMSYYSDGKGEQDGLVTILYLQDLNHDGISAEFPVYNYQACGYVDQCLLGYDPKTDRIRQFSVDLQIQYFESDQPNAPADSIDQIMTHWLPNLPVRALKKQVVLSHDFYAGHGADSWESYALSVDTTSGNFKGTVKVRPIGQHAPWISGNASSYSVW